MKFIANMQLILLDHITLEAVSNSDQFWEKLQLPSLKRILVACGSQTY